MTTTPNLGQAHATSHQPPPSHRPTRRSWRRSVWLALIAGLVWCGTGAQAQYTGNNKTNIISNVTSNWSGSYYIGNTYHQDVLILTNAGVLNNITGYIGYAVGANNNSVTVTDAGSVWSNSSGLYVGNKGAGNQLTIANGGAVYNLDTSNANIGGASGSGTTGSNNAVIVTGTGSVWSNSGGLSVGTTAARNTLTITNGGTVYNTTAFVGNLAGADNNTVLVTDAGSVWSNSADLYMGRRSENNQLLIANGGAVYDRNGIIGSDQASASNNTVLVTGAGSVWNNSGSLSVGSYGSNNSLMITNGGAVVAGNGLYINAKAGSTNNVLNISGGQLTVGATLANAGAVTVTAGELTVAGAFTNSGTVTMNHSVGTFQGAVFNSGAWITDPSTNIFAGTYTVDASGYIAAAAGDVYIFTNGASTAANFINNSTQADLYDTALAKFLFGGTSLATQEYYTAGVNLGTNGVANNGPHLQQITQAEFDALGTNNYAVGTLVDAGNLGIYGGNGPLGSALYVDNLVLEQEAKLFIDSNTWLYYVNADIGTDATISYAPGSSGGGVKSVPEPSMFGLLGLGVGVCGWYAWRKKTRTA